MNARRFAPLAFALLLALAPRQARGADPFGNQFFRAATTGTIVPLGDDADLAPTGNFTIETWVRAEPGQALSPYPIVLTKPAGVLAYGECTYGFVIERATGHVSFRVTTTDGTFQATWNGNLLDGAWHHLNGRRSTGAGGFLHLDVDGTTVANTLITGAVLTSAQPLQVGGVAFGGYTGNWLLGDVDEVRLWNFDRPADLYRFWKIDRRAGLVAAWHFDRLYPDLAGNALLVDSAHGRIAASAGATLGSGGPAIQSGQSLLVADALIPAPGSGPRPADAVVRLPGGRELVARRLLGAHQANVTELAVLSTTTVPRLRGSLAIPGAAPIVQMAARDSTVWCVKLTPGGAYRLFAVRLATPSQPEVFGDSLDLPQVTRLSLDPATPNQIAFIGWDPYAGSNLLGVVDVTNPAAPFLATVSSLGGTGAIGTLSGLAKRGSYLYTTSSDAGLRIYRYDVFTFNGNVIRTISPVGSTVGVGDTCAVAVSGTRLYTASRGGSFRVFDLTSPTAPVQLGWQVDDNMVGEDLQVDGNWAVVAGANGVHYLNVATPSNPITIGRTVLDLPASGSPRVTFRDGWIGVTSGIGGYHLLETVTTTAVGSGGEDRVRPLTAGPNPSRGAVAFELPAGGGARTLEIFDTLGRRVRSWKNEAPGAAAARWTWDGRDERGAAVPAGVYLARTVDAGGLVHRARVAIVR